MLELVVICELFLCVFTTQIHFYPLLEKVEQNPLLEKVEQNSNGFGYTFLKGIFAMDLVIPF